MCSNVAFYVFSCIDFDLFQGRIREQEREVEEERRGRQEDRERAGAAERKVPEYLFHI
jgi:hypothetical protein